MLFVNLNHGDLYPDLWKNDLYFSPAVLKSDWLSIVLISALIGQYASCLSNWTVHAIQRALKWHFLSLLAKNSRNFSCFD